MKKIELKEEVQNLRVTLEFLKRAERHQHLISSLSAVLKNYPVGDAVTKLEARYKAAARRLDHQQNKAG